jgi:stage III sporulation protein AB
MSLSNEQMKLIESFGDCIGKSYGRIQVEGFDYYICSLSKIIEKEKSEIDKNVKLYRTLGIAAGACAAILLI